MPPRLGEASNIDFDLAAYVHLHVGKILVTEDVAIQLLDQRRRPEGEKALPGAALPDGGMKVIQ